MLAALFRRCHVRQLRCRSRGFVLVVAAVLGVLVALAAPSAAAATARCPWSDAAKPANERAAELVGAMTLDEKIGMLHGAEPVDGGHYGADGHVAGIPRLCVPELVLNGAGAGVGLTQRGAPPRSRRRSPRQPPGTRRCSATSARRWARKLSARESTCSSAGVSTLRGYR